LNWSKWIRQFHRWLAIIFTLAVVFNLIALVTKQQAVWIGVVALIPLILLMITGLYMFFLPYFARRRP
jgi:heme A synthase